MSKKLADRVTLSGTRLTQDGYLVTEAFAVRTGIQLYTGSEIDDKNELGLRDKPIVRVYRAEDEVRSPASLQSFSHAPITIGHPNQPVTSDNWKDLAVGEVSTEAVWDNNKIKLPLILKDKNAINGVIDGTRELSAGYTCEIHLQSGTTADGQVYDAVQKNIQINHLAVVPQGRAGHECRIGDADNWGASPIDKEVKMTTKHIALGDTTAEVMDKDADKVTSYIKGIQDKFTAQIDAKDAEIAKKDAEIATLKASQMSDAQLDQRVAERAQLVEDAKKIAPDVEFKGLSDQEIRKKAVVSVDAEYADKSDAYINAMFDIQLKQAEKDNKTKQQQDNVMLGSLKSTNNQQQDALGYNAREQELLNNWNKE